jgi:hypothetical protein
VEFDTGPVETLQESGDFFKELTENIVAGNVRESSNWF